MVDFLIDTAEAEIDMTDHENWTPLSLAARAGHLEIVEKLLDNEAEINVLQNSGTALFWAAKNSELDTVVLLLEYDADPNICGKTWSPLHAACQNGDIEIAQILIGNSQSGNLRIFLLLQIYVKSLSFADHGANTNSTGSKTTKHLPLHVACMEGHLEIVEYLLDNGARVNERDSSTWRSALHWACFRYTV